MTYVLIAGAGPTGLTLACELALRGVPFRLVEAADTPFVGSRAKGVQPRTLEVFDRMGIVQEILAAGSTETPYRRHQADGHFVDVPRPGLASRPDVPWPSPLLIAQWRTEGLLRARLEALGGRIEYGVAVVSAQALEDGVRVTLRRAGTDTTIEATWLVGCDGGKSSVRRFAGLDFIGETHEQLRMLVGDMQVTGVDRDHWHVWRPSGGGFVALAPLKDAGFQVQIAVGPATSDATTLDNFQRQLECGTGRSDIRLSDPTWTSLWRANVRMVERYRAGPMLVAGDAAHVHSPAGGQGMNTGIQDAFNLGWKLAALQRGADMALIDTYEAERLPVARHVLQLSNQLMASAVDSKTGGVVRRDEDVFQLGVGYRDSSLSRDHRLAPGRVRAGDRAPDAEVSRHVDGARFRLFDLFRGPRATLLAFGSGWLSLLDIVLAAGTDTLDAACVVRVDDGSTEAATVQCYLDPEQLAQSTWDVQCPTLFVVRPDGVVGLATVEFNVDQVLDWTRAAGLTVDGRRTA